MLASSHSWAQAQGGHLFLEARSPLGHSTGWRGLTPAAVHTHICGGGLPVTRVLLRAGGQGRSRSPCLCRRRLTALGVSCLVFLATMGPSSQGLSHWDPHRVLQMPGFLPLGPIICRPLTQLPWHPPAICARTGGGAPPSPHADPWPQAPKPSWEVAAACTSTEVKVMLSRASPASALPPGMKQRGGSQGQKGQVLVPKKQESRPSGLYRT